MMEGMMYGKKVSLLVEEQLRYCRSLRRADMLSVVQVFSVGVLSALYLATVTVLSLYAPTRFCAVL